MLNLHISEEHCFKIALIHLNKSRVMFESNPLLFVNETAG